MPTLSQLVSFRYRTKKQDNGGRGISSSLFYRSEASHRPIWPTHCGMIFRRSLRHVSMLGVLLKATAAINHGAGPYRSGTRRITLRQAAKELMEKADEPYMEALTERVLFDRGWAVGNDILSKQEFSGVGCSDAAFAIRCLA